jgi:hypothetical protein
MEPASFHDPRVEAAFAAFPDSTRDALLGLRALIFQTAAETAGVGPVEETLKWGQPAYLTRETGAGTTIRLGVPKAGGAAIYVHCQTTIIGEVRDIYPDAVRYEGSRAIVLSDAGEMAADPVRLLISRALTYHLRSARAGDRPVSRVRAS